MASLAFDTRRVSQRLLDAGFVDRQAAILTDVFVEVSDATRREVATKADLELSEARLKAELQAKTGELKTELQSLRLETETRSTATRTEMAVIKTIGGLIAAMQVGILVKLFFG